MSSPAGSGPDANAGATGERETRASAAGEPARAAGPVGVRGAAVWGRPSAAASAVAESGPPLRAVLAGDAAFRADGGRLPWCTVGGASVAGVRHRLAGEAGQDAWGWAIRSASSLVLAVADGLGSRPGSGEVAAAAVQATLDLMDAGSAASVVEAVNRLLVDGSATEGACTLVVGLVTSEGRYDLARVGDSTVFALRDGRWDELFVPPDDADSVPLATAAVPTAEPEIEAAAGELGDGEALVLVTDGVGDPLRDGPTSVAPALAGGLAGPVTPLQLAWLADFSRQGCHDDRTIVALWYQRQPA